ncbi:hypothetical protein CK203_116298 [Vitis vinifera]|uniref:Reverse transcriptase Ty1/copia-type domain-containing protein n=1 Tax=Vitis vinifera TaxID=29760 RepID=A0A438CAJ5_VITVI|nr:hypothetical protein CK203_116298 [Vitis vinifera]
MLPSFIYTRINALNSIPAQFSVFFWRLSTLRPHPLLPLGAPQNEELNWLRAVATAVDSTPSSTISKDPSLRIFLRHNRGTLDRYSPNIEDRRLKYPIANYVSTKTLPEPLKTFADALSSCQVPTRLKKQERPEGKLTALILYVDDMIITGDDSEKIARLQEQLASKFEMKNLGGLKYFLGIEVARSKRRIFLSQRKYILDLLTERKLGYLESKKQKVVTLSSAEAEFYGMAKGLYQQDILEEAPVFHLTEEEEFINSFIDIMFRPKMQSRRLETIIKVGEADESLGHIDINLFSQVIDKADGLGQIENLRAMTLPRYMRRRKRFMRQQLRSDYWNVKATPLQFVNDELFPQRHNLEQLSPSFGLVAMATLFLHELIVDEIDIWTPSIGSNALYDALQYVLAEAEKIKDVARWEDDVQVDCFHAKSGANYAKISPQLSETIKAPIAHHDFGANFIDLMFMLQMESTTVFKGFIRHHSVPLKVPRAKENFMLIKDVVYRKPNPSLLPFPTYFPADDEDSWSTEGYGQFAQVSESEDEAPCMDSDTDDVEDFDRKDGEEFDIPRSQNVKK